MSKKPSRNGHALTGETFPTSQDSFRSEENIAPKPEFAPVSAKRNSSFISTKGILIGLVVVICGTMFVAYMVSSLNSKVPLDNTQSKPLKLLSPVEPISDVEPKNMSPLLSVAGSTDQFGDGSYPELAALSKALADLKADAEIIAGTLRGDGMAMITEEDLSSLVQENIALREEISLKKEEVEVTNELVKEAEQEITLLREQVASREAQIRQFEAERDAYIAKTKDIIVEAKSISLQEESPVISAEAKPSVTMELKPSESETKVAKKVPLASSTRKPSNADKNQALSPGSELPFSFIGLTDSFVVVKTPDGDFTSLAVGRTYKGVTIQKIDASKNKITTSAGIFSMKPTNK